MGARRPRRTVRARIAAFLARLPVGRDRMHIDYPKGPR